MIPESEFTRNSQDLQAKIKEYTTWHERALYTLELHELYQAQKGIASKGPGKWGWGVRDTAALLEASKTNVYCDIQLGRALRRNPILATKRRRYVLGLIKTGKIGEGDS